MAGLAEAVAGRLARALHYAISAQGQWQLHDLDSPQEPLLKLQLKPTFDPDELPVVDYPPPGMLEAAPAAAAAPGAVAGGAPAAEAAEPDGSRDGGAAPREDGSDSDGGDEDGGPPEAADDADKD